MKKIISFLMVLTLILSAFCMVVSAEEELAGDYYLAITQVNNNKLFVNGIPLEFDEANPEVMPIQDEDGNILVPLRAVVGIIGGWIDWEEATDSVLINYNGETISFAMNSNEIKIGEETVEVEVAPYTVHDRTVVSLDFFSKVLGGNAEVDADTNTIMLAFITKVYAAG